MERDNKFIYKKPVWEVEGRKATFFYQLEHGEEVFNFTETLVFPTSQPISNIPQNLLNNVLDSLSLALGISYYKLYCPKQIVLEGLQLSKEQAEFWNKVYTKGLGEFFYKNKIDFRELISFPFNDEQTECPKCSEVDCPPSLKATVGQGKSAPAELSLLRQAQDRNDKKKLERSLVGIGGGKDSIVTAELLKSLKKPFIGFAVETHAIKERVAQILGVDLIIVKRQIDPKLFELNKKPGVYNGHVPVSSIYAFIGLLTALLYDYRNIIVSNEQSANYGNTTYLGEKINHQWSKSFEFEVLFQEYVKNYLTPDVTYFSLLRPFSEIAIVKCFADYPQYFSVFSSCNRNFKITEKTNIKWCARCAKCAFAFAMFSAFLPKKQLVNIFGQNLFNRSDLLQVYKELLGVSAIKPFDCVGTPEEVQVAFYLAMLRREYENDIAMKFFQKEVLPKIKNIDTISNEVFKLSIENRIPEEFQGVLNL
jgi:hypothetical protein